MTRPNSRGRDRRADRELLSIKEACKRIGVSRRTMHNWIAEGKVRYERTAGGHKRIVAASLTRRPTDEEPE